ncbi:MAG: glycosyltransferase family 2 protein, partial [Actinomycetota bacterium]|nr:glycosyltransferase family 2 protein [Actinomycetota bacterium]
QISAFKLPTLFNSVGDLIFGFFNNPFLSRFTSRYGHYDREMQVGWVSGACLVAKREAIEKIGGWDENFFMYSEDVAIGIKARQYGLKTFFFPGAEITHLRNKSSKDIQRRIMQVYESRVKLRKAYFGSSKFIIYAAFTSLIILSRAVIYMFKFLLQKFLGNEATFERERTTTYLWVASLHIKSVFGG